VLTIQAVTIDAAHLYDMFGIPYTKGEIVIVTLYGGNIDAKDRDIKKAKKNPRRVPSSGMNLIPARI
jgi:hypothetical protein